MFSKRSDRLKRPRRNTLKPVVDGLEKREVYAVSVTVSGGVLTANISGTDPAQNFDLRSSGPSRKLVFNDGTGWKDVLSGGRTVSAGTLTRIVVNGSDMANVISLGNVSSRSGFNSALENRNDPRIVINGRGGDDGITGSDFSDKIDAGAGNDHVNGFQGHDSLIAGSGQDTLFGGHGDDTIIAMSPSPNSLFDGGGGNNSDRYRGKRPGNFVVRNFKTIEYV